MRDFFEPVFRSIGFLSLRERTLYFSFISARIVTNTLDIAGLAGVAVFGGMLAAGVEGRKVATMFGVSIPLGDPSVYLLVISVVVVLFLLKSTLAAALLRANGYFLAGVESRKSAAALAYVFGSDLGRIRRYPIADLQWASNGSMAMAYSNILANFSVLISEASLFLLIVAVFAFTDLLTALLISAYFLILLTVYQLFITTRLKQAGASIKEGSVGGATALLDLGRSFRELLVLAKTRSFLDRFHQFRELESRGYARLRFFEGIPRFFVESALMIGVMGLVGWQIYRGNLTEGLTITAVFLAGGIRMMGALLPLQNAVTWIGTSGPQARPAHELLDFIHRGTEAITLKEGTSPSTHENHTLAGPQYDWSSPPEVILEEVSFRFEDAERDVFSNFSMTVEAGTIAAIVGPSGAGKTTLVDLMLGLYRPQEGNVRVGGVAPSHIREHFPGVIAYVPQRPGMVSGTVAENVALGQNSNQVDEERISRVLEAVGLLKELTGGEGIHSDMGAHADGLSGGQLQRLGLARALYTSPKVIVLDEATSALDATSEAEVIRYIEALRGSTTVIIVAHRLSTIQRADRVFVLEDGQIIGEGPFSEVRKTVPLVEEYVRLMSFDS